MNRLIHFQKTTPLLLVITRILFLFTLLCAAVACVQMVHAETVTNTAESGRDPLHQVLAAAMNGDAGMALHSAHGLAAVSESSIAPNGINAQKSARVEFSATRQSVGGCEIAGFSARQAGTAREENL